MKTKRISVAVVLIVLLSLSFLFVAGCSSIKINTDFDPQANFSQLQSFGWMPVPPAPPGVQGARAPLADNPFINQLIKKAITHELVENKFKLGVFGAPDFMVAYHAGTRSKTEEMKWDYEYYLKGVELHQYTEGTLVIDIVDPETSRLLWRGVAKDVITGKGKAKKGIDKAVKSILSKFPPR